MILLNITLTDLYFSRIDISTIFAKDIVTQVSKKHALTGSKVYTEIWHYLWLDENIYHVLWRTRVSSLEYKLL